MLKVDRVFVLHVKQGYEQREVYMKGLLTQLGIEGCDWILDHDITDLDSEALSEFFSDDMALPSPYSSCAMKHVEVLLQIEKNGYERVLVLEDDVCLHKNFVEIVNQTIEEFEREYNTSKPMCISYEATHMKFIPRSERRKDKLLYPSRMLQCAATMVLNRAYAVATLEQFRTQKCDVPVDLYYDSLRQRGVVDMLQVYPEVSWQGSHLGMFNSSIGNASVGFKRIIRPLMYWFKKNIIYNLR